MSRSPGRNEPCGSGTTVAAPGQEVTELPPVLRQWLQQSLCPKARGALVFRLDLRVIDAEAQAAGLQGFLAARRTGRSVLIIEAEQDGTNHGEAESLAQDLFVRLVRALVLVESQERHPGVLLSRERPPDKLLARVRQRVDQMVRLSRRCHEPPILWWRDASFVTIALSPHYRMDHPRWAPRLCLVMTWAQDVVAARSILPHVVAEVARRLSGHAHPYDFKKLYVREESPMEGP